MFDCYYNAVFVQCPDVLGRRLHSLSLGHCRLLTAMRSPIIDGEWETAKHEDVIAAIYICSMPYAEAEEKIRSGAFETECQEWGEAAAKIDDREAEFDKFFSYFVEHIKSPPRYEYISKGGKIIKPEAGAVPWFFSVAWALMDRVPEDRAWNMPLPLAFAYHAAHCQFNGDEFLVKEPEPKKEETPEGAE